MNSAGIGSNEDLAARIASVDWYHTVDLGNGVVTPGHYDHRNYLDLYGLPESLSEKTALDLGAASGFFSFELERRGAKVTATDLPEWYDHDFGPNYSIEQDQETLQNYLREPFEIARQALGADVEKKFINIYDVSPETVGIHDFVFCGSLLIHLTDPIKALRNIASVTGDKAIIATVITEDDPDRPFAYMTGYDQGDSFWVPTRSCLELMAASSGFAGVEWHSDFRLDYSDGSPGPYHGVIHAYKKESGWSDKTISSEAMIEQQRDKNSDAALAGDARQRELDQLKNENARLRDQVAAFEQRKFIRLTRRLRGK